MKRINNDIVGLRSDEYSFWHLQAKSKDITNEQLTDMVNKFFDKNECYQIQTTESGWRISFQTFIICYIGIE